MNTRKKTEVISFSNWQSSLQSILRAAVATGLLYAIIGRRFPSNLRDFATIGILMN